MDMSYNCPNNAQKDTINFVRISDPIHQEDLYPIGGLMKPKDENLHYTSVGLIVSRRELILKHVLTVKLH